MKLLLKISFAFLLIQLTTSCATIFNSKIIEVNIVTNEPTFTVVNDDSLGFSKYNRTFVTRSEHPLIIKNYTDSSSKTIRVRSRNSPMFYANLGILYGLPILIDLTNNKRFKYPKTIYVDMQDSVVDYLRFIPLSNVGYKHNSIIKITPLKIIGFYNPSIELSYERKTSKSFSTQLMASYLFTNLPSSLFNERNDYDVSGFRVAIEEKYYLRQSAIQGSYLGFEADYLDMNYKTVEDFISDNIPANVVINGNIVRTPFYTDTIDIKRQTLSFNFKYGYQTIRNRISVDFFIGMGVKFRKVEHSNRINPNDRLEVPFLGNVRYSRNFEATVATLSFPLNIRVGYVF